MPDIFAACIGLGRVGTSWAMTAWMSAALLLVATPLAAEPVADFYRGKTINLLIGTSTGNDYDFRARLIARHMPRHIPGEPQILARNMPGGGGVVAANYLANIAPRDGTVLHAIMSNMMTTQAMGVQGVLFDTRRSPSTTTAIRRG